MKKNLKPILMEAAVVLAFAVIASVYFAPAFKGWRLTGEDNSANDGLRVEINKYREANNGETPRWINSIFGGMPTYQIAPSYDSTKTMSFVEKIYHLGLPDYVWYVFASMLGFYILLRAFDFRRWMAVLGAIVWAFSSYFFIIIAAGHLWKAITLAYIPPTIAGMVLCFKGKYLWGFIITALFATLQINGNHVQMTYYFLIPEILLYLTFIFVCVKKAEIKKLGLATLAITAAAVIAVGMNASNLYHTYKYSEDTMRGKSELVKEGKEDDQTDSGLERSYITNWSYGISETWTLLIPNVKGGASVPLVMNKTAMKKADPQINNAGIYNQVGQYWGEQPGTSGPVYVGALVCMLFVLALIVIPNRNPWKWALVAATILSILLSWGKNFMGFTDFFIDYIPMYAKFRAVESILVIAEFTIPLLAMLALKEVICGGVTSDKSSDKINDKDKSGVRKPYNTYQSSFIISYLATAGFCLLFALLPGMFFDFYTNAEYAYFSQSLPPADVTTFMESLARARQSVFTADCWRSFLIITIGAVLLMLYRARKLKALPTVLLILALCLVDLWQVNKRYLNDDMFKPRRERQQIRPLTDADRRIKADPALYYRVLNLNGNVFNENETSYYHKSVGGYHAAKLRRYQELIETYISKQLDDVRQSISSSEGDLAQVDGDSLWNVLNMLNAKYFLMVSQQEPQKSFELQNPYAYGNAWLVDEVRYVDNANEELDGLAGTDLRRVAVADKMFQQVLGQATEQDSTATDAVVLKSYAPNELKYDVDSRQGGVVVFSEIYYPGWEATVDGQNVELGRVDYVLRAMNIPAGKHEVVMRFFPKSIDTTETLAYVALAVLALLTVLLAVVQVRGRKP